MQKIPLQITIHDLPPSEALEAHIRDRVNKLDVLFAHIPSCRVLVEMSHRHQQQGKQFNVRFNSEKYRSAMRAARQQQGKQFNVCINLDIPGNKIAINRSHHADVYVALRDAFDAVRRQLEDYVHRLQHTAKTHTLEHVGCVTRILHRDGFGFISGTDGNELYFHRDNVISPSFDQLRVGDEVKFVEELSTYGPQAKRISA